MYSEQPVLNPLEFEALTVNIQGEIIQRQHHQAFQFSEDLGAGVTLEMVAIPGGMFSMGSHGHMGYEDEHPQHLVTLKSFYIGRFAVTQQQWQAVTSKQLPCRFRGDRRPLERVSWNDAQDFCRSLEGLTARPYRLPSEAEWEYACRAQTATPFHCGPTITTDLANYVGEHLFAEEPKGIYRHETTVGGQFCSQCLWSV